MTALPDIEDPPSSLWRDAWRRLRRNRLAVAGLVIIAALVIIAIFGPWLSPYDFLSQNLDLRNQPPSAAHWLGTDDLGRDVLSRLIYGARTALMVAVGVTVIAVAIGVLLGAIAGFMAGGSTGSSCGSPISPCRCRSSFWSLSSTRA